MGALFEVLGRLFGIVGRLIYFAGRRVFVLVNPESGPSVRVMPITGPSSYPATIDEFLAHWADVNDSLGGELTVPEGSTHDDLVTLKDDLEGERDGVSDRGIDRQVARGDLDDRITTLQGRLVEFNARVRGDLPGHVLADSLPDAFTVGQGEDVVRGALRKMDYIWQKVNAISPTPPGVTLPMTLDGAYAVAAFTTARGALRTAYGTLSKAEVDVDLARSARNGVQDNIYPILKSYRKKVAGMEATHPDWVATLPRLSPEPGATPSAVTAHVVWDATAEKAKITWGASSDADLEKYEVRGVAGDSYNTDDESVIGTVLAGGTREFLTDFGLASSGLTAGFKVYVVLNTGNEKGSAAVYLTRPV